MDKRDIGTGAEELASKYLCEQGLTVICKNYRAKTGEIDLICKDGDYFVFCEVKYRKSDEFGNPLYAVDREKQKKIIKTSIFYLTSNHLSVDAFIRYDVVSICGDEIEWLKNAFLAY